MEISEHGPEQVLFINHTSTMGGGEIALLALSRELAARSSAYRVLLLNEGPLVDELRRLLTVHVLPLNRSLLDASRTSLGTWYIILRCLWLPVYIIRIARLVRHLRVTLVHTNSLKAALIGGIAGRLGGAKVIWHIRDRIASDYLPSRTAAIIRKLALHVPTAIIANSGATLDSLGLTEQMSRRPFTRVIHDGVDVARFFRSPVFHDPLVIGILGRISPWKGQDVFIKAAARVHDVYPHVRFRIIGSPLFGEQEYANSLSVLVTSLQLEAVVEFSGFVEDTAGALQNLDIVVHASTIGEPFGQVIIEGMAAGKPVIASSGGGVPEIVQNDITGLLVPMGDVEALTTAMITLVVSPSLRAEFGVSGRTRVEQHFRIDQVADHVTAFHAEVLDATLSK